MIKNVINSTKDNSGTKYSNAVTFESSKETDGVVSTLPLYIAIY